MLSVNGQNVQTHSQVSDIIRSSEGLVSLLIDKTQDMEKPDLSKLGLHIRILLWIQKYVYRVKSQLRVDGFTIMHVLL